MASPGPAPESTGLTGCRRPAMAQDCDDAPQRPTSSGNPLPRGAPGARRAAAATPGVAAGHRGLPDVPVPAHVPSM